MAAHGIADRSGHTAKVYNRRSVGYYPHMERKERILHLLLQHARPLICEEFRADSCIASTRIGLDVLDYFGILAEPLAVCVTIFNPVMVERRNLGDQLPQNKTEMEEWVKKYGAWAVGVGYGGDQGPMKWPGHLVMLVEKTLMLDLSIDQANRPQHNIELHPFGTMVFPEFLSGQESLLAEVNGCMLRYLVQKDNRGYTASPNWMIRLQRHSPYRPTTFTGPNLFTLRHGIFTCPAGMEKTAMTAILLTPPSPALRVYSPRISPKKPKYGMILSPVEYCPCCKLSYSYPIMLEDDVGVLRVIGEPLDKCPCGMCEDCHGKGQTRKACLPPNTIPHPSLREQPDAGREDGTVHPLSA